MGPTKELAQFIAKSSWADFPPETVEFTKGMLLKTITGMVVGCREPIGRKITRYISGAGGSPEAGIAGSGFQTSVEYAAMAHGIFAHASELEDDEFPDDMGDFWVFPSIFTLGEKLISSGKDIIEAAIVGWEVHARLTRAAPGAVMFEEVGLLTANYFGCLGTAAAAAKLLKLTPNEIENALSIAAAQASGLVGHIGYDPHYLETGFSARSGVLSALLAKEGLEGRPGIVELSFGGLYAPVWHIGKVNLDSIVDGLGKPPFDVHNVWIKKFPCCFAVHPAVDALMMIMRENPLKYEEVERVELEVDKITANYVDRPADSLNATRFSLYYAIGEVLLRGKIDLSSFTEVEKLSDPKLKEAQSKVRVTVPSDWQHFMAHGTRVTVIKKNGQELTKHLKVPIGHPESPLSFDQIVEICRPFLDAIMQQRQRERAEEILVSLEKQVDIQELMNILTFFRNMDRR